MRPSPTSDLPFRMEAFEANQAEILIRMGTFFVAYLHRLRLAFDGDLTMAIVLGEIGHHNASGYFSPQEGMRRHIVADARFNSMPCCNAHSLSESTGIPRETIRRKIGALIALGWIEKVEGRGVRITPACVDQFARSFNIPTLAELLTTARTLGEILQEHKPTSEAAE